MSGWPIGTVLRPQGPDTGRRFTVRQLIHAGGVHAGYYVAEGPDLFTLGRRSAEVLLQVALPANVLHDDRALTPGERESLVDAWKRVHGAGRFETVPA